MRRLNDTITRLRAGQAGFSPMTGSTRSARLVAAPPPAVDPGDLTGWCHVPDVPGAMALVVVLHGCTQTAADYDRGSGWSTLAERHGFAVLFPEQQRGNNPNGCFNWFAPADVRRGSGEVASIRAMIAAMAERYAIDPARVYVTGLSAGGAMAAALLATYPEVFAGGAIVGGLPFGAADTMPQAFDRMRGHGHPDAARYAAKVRAASDHAGRWPAVSVWHGDADATVAPGNADAILGQWRGVHGIDGAPAVEDRVDGARHRAWHDGDGRIAVEEYRIAGMGHGTPIATRGDMASGVAGPFMLDVGISSTWHIAARWGLIDAAVASIVAPTLVDEVEEDRLVGVMAPRHDPAPAPAPAPAAFGVQATIEAALRQAGLMR